MCNVRALLKRLVDDLLGPDELATTLALIRGDDDFGVGIVDAVAKRIRAEASEDDGVYCTDTCAGEESVDCFGNHGQVDCHGITLLHAHLLQHPGELRHLAQKLGVGDCPALALLVGLVDDRCLVWVLRRMSIDAVVRCIQSAFGEPRIITAGESAAVYGLEVSLP